MESRLALAVGVGALALGLVVVAGSMGAADSRIAPAEVETVVEAAGNEKVGGGADVIVGVLNGTTHWGSVGDITAYSVGTTSCNIGDQDLEWTSSTNRHPVIGQNMFRLANDRLMQIGQSWLKHGFLALAQNACNLGCQDPNNGALLGVGCSDPYGSGLNGSQGGLGPRFEVNASTGHFLYPFSFDNQNGNAIYKRLQVKTNDVDPALNGSARYFVEGHYVTPDDAAAGNQNNNASYREVSVGGSLGLSFVAETVQELPAIYAWQAVDPTVAISTVDVTDDGRFIVANKVIDNLDGTWRYEYAIHNLNSHRSANSFTIEIGAGTNITNVGFHDVPYHSGEPYDNADWVPEVTADSVSWGLAGLFVNGFESGNVAEWEEDYELGNALRWGTMYNFWFTADSPPVTATGSMGLHRVGLPLSADVRVQGPE